MKDTILLPRIAQALKSGIIGHYIFYGTSGLGKTTLANILTDEHNTLKIKKNVGVDVLRSKILDHCKSLDLSAKGYKIIYIDEFDRASAQVQDELKSFMEDYSENVRFICTTNHINKIAPELRSRFKQICFDPISSDEREFLHKKQVFFLRGIAKNEGSDLHGDVELMTNIVNKNFPDLRASIIELDNVLVNGVDVAETSNTSDSFGLFEFIMGGDLNPNVNFDYVMDNFFINFDDAYKYLSRPFIVYLRQFHMDLFLIKGGAIFDTQAKFNDTFEQTLDPIVHLLNYIMKLKISLK